MKKLLLSTILIFLVTSIHSLSAISQVPHLIGYQGRLTDAQGSPKEGSHQITFRIYDAEAAGNLLWQETHPNVTVTNGIFDVLLGGVTPLDLPFDKQYYLAIQVGSDPEMTPRQQIASVGYSFRAKDVDSLPVGSIIMWHGSINAIPEGWVLCDGTNGTPNMMDKFIKSVPDASTDPGRTGGVLSHTHTGPVHSHDYTTSAPEKMNAWVDGKTENIYIDITGNYGYGWHSVPSFTPNTGNEWLKLTGTATQASGGGNTGATTALPPYYEVVFIMKIT